MKQRLLFDRVNSHRRGLSVVKDMENAPIISSHPTNTELARINHTAPLTVITAYSRSGKLLVKIYFNHAPAPHNNYIMLEANDIAKTSKLMAAQTAKRSILTAGV